MSYFLHLISILLCNCNYNKLYKHFVQFTAFTLESIVYQLVERRGGRQGTFLYFGCLHMSRPSSSYLFTSMLPKNLPDTERLFQSSHTVQSSLKCREEYWTFIYSRNVLVLTALTRSNIIIISKGGIVLCCVFTLSTAAVNVLLSCWV